MERDEQWVRGKCIGKGSFGTVSLAFDRSDWKTFAVKSVGLNQQKSLLDSLEKEIEILRSLDSMYIVSYLGNSTAQGFRNLHMEYMPAGTLADVAGKMDELRIRTYTRGVVEALSYLHSVAGVIHSDVKGQNVLLGAAPGSAKLADFGSAARINVLSNGAKTPIGGTPLWMAPEVVRGEGVTPESDVWSLGCTVIEMATGYHPWRNSNHYSPSSSITDKLFRIGFGDELPELPTGLLSRVGLDFVGKCLRRRQEERWTAEQLLQHPFLTDVAGTSTGFGESPRSTLDWVNFSEFDDDDTDEQSCDGHAMELGRERIRKLGEINNGEIVDWDSDEGWEVIRSFDEQEKEEMGNLDDRDEENFHCSTIISVVPTCRKESEDEKHLQT